MPAVSASPRLHRIAAEMRAAGDTGNLLALRRGMRAAPAPLIAAVRDAARAQLPKTGGLNEWEASQKISVSIRTGARTAGVRIVTRTKASKQTDEGFVRHPIFGRTGKGSWVTQQVPLAAGWWSDTLARKSPEVTPLLMWELLKVEARIRAV